jgi:hypothetical protein
MAQRLPNVGSDDGSWGTILNNYLLVSLNDDGTLRGLGQANGVAPLDSTGKVPTANLPAISGVIAVTSSTASATAAKVGTTSGGSYTPTTGDVINVTFTLGISVNSPTLNIDGSGAKAIYLGTSAVTTTVLSTSASSVVVPMFYDGTHWQLYGSQLNTNTTYTSMTVAEGQAGTATTPRTLQANFLKSIIQYQAPVTSVASKTGVVTLTSADVGLGNVTNDAQLKVSDLDTDSTLAANSDTKVASQKAIKTYVNNSIPGQILATAKLTTPLNNGCEPLNMPVSPETTDVAFTVPATGNVDIDVSVSAAVYGVSHIALALVIGSSSLGSMIPRVVATTVTNTNFYDLGRFVGGGIGQTGGVLTKNLHITGLTPGASMKFTLMYAITGYMTSTPTPNSLSTIGDICLNTDQSLAVCSDFMGQYVGILARGRLPEQPSNQWMTRIFPLSYTGQIALHPSVTDMILVTGYGTSTTVFSVDPYLGKMTAYLGTPSGGETTFTAIGMVSGGGGYAATTPASGTKPVLYAFSGAPPSSGVWGTKYTLPTTQPANASLTRLKCGTDGYVYIASGTTITAFKTSTSTFVQVSPGLGNVNDVAVASNASFIIVACANGLARYNLPLTSGASKVWTAGTSRGSFCRVAIGPNDTAYWSSLNGTTSNTQGFMYGYADDGTSFDNGAGYVCTALTISKNFDILSTYGGSGSVTSTLVAGNVNEWFGGSLMVISDNFWCEYAEVTVRSAK